MFLLPLYPIFCCSDSKLRGVQMQGYCVMVVSSSTTNIALLHVAVCMHQQLLHQTTFAI